MIDPTIRHQPEFYEDSSNIIEVLAEDLINGRLCIVVGAGASKAFDLPQWGELIESIEETCGVIARGESNEEKSTWLFRNAANRNREKFAKLVHEALYKNFKFDINDLSRKPLMMALGAISLAGIKGGVNEIITFNFDDLLEMYLRCFGVIVKSTNTLPSLSTVCDLEVLHIHGTLSFQTEKIEERGIVFTSQDFDEVLGDSTTYWRQRVEHILRSNSCLFIGVSGDDQNLRTILNRVSSCHPIYTDRKYWGFRFSRDQDDKRKDDFEEYGIFQITTSHDQIPYFLLAITQRAAELRNYRDWYDES